MTEQTDAHPSPWRQGRKVPRNVYDADDAPILMAPDDETAARIVAAVNRAAAAEARGAERALREAADAADRSNVTGLETTRPDHVAAWLRARAAQVAPSRVPGEES